MWDFYDMIAGGHNSISLMSILSELSSSENTTGYLYACFPFCRRLTDMSWADVVKCLSNSFESNLLGLLQEKNHWVNGSGNRRLNLTIQLEWQRACVANYNFQGVSLMV